MTWHQLTHLGHPSSSIVRFVVSNNNLPCVSDPSLDLVCDACQLGKSYQLPYPKSTSVSTSFLELICSDIMLNYYVPTSSPKSLTGRCIVI
jgi:hypothetical protein